MISIKLDEVPVTWVAPKFGRGRAYDPKEAEKRATRFLIRQQYNGPLLDCIVRINLVFLIKIPKSASKKKRAEMLRHDIIPTKKDCTNLQKYYEDCLKKIVIKDDRNVEYISSLKLYAEKDGVLITIHPRD